MKPHWRKSRKGRSPRWKLNQKLKCNCLGYHFPHRKGGGACETSKTQIYHLCIRQGMDHMSAMAEMILETPAAVVEDTSEIPF